jgi:hypothetical protein
MHWLMAHLAAISTGVSIATLLVWIFYARILQQTFRRNERPLILIHQAQAGSEESFCLVANLSRQPLHVVTVDLVVRTAEHEIELRINDYHRITNTEESEWAVESVMKEGPLRVGEYIALGGFKEMLDATRSDGDRDDEAHARQDQQLAEQARELEIRISAVFSAFDNPIGAVRRFTVTTDDGRVRLEPVTPMTRQLQTRRQRRQVYRWLQKKQRQAQAIEAR